MSLSLTSLADTPQYGGIYFDSAVEIDGVEYPAKTTVYATTYPTQMVVRPIVAEGKTFQWYSSAVPRSTYINKRSSENSFYGSLAAKFPYVRVPRMDGTYLMTPPGDSSVVITNKAVCAAKVVYVATNGVDEATAGTAAAPFKTIQYAVDYLFTNYKYNYTMVLVKPGVYNEGGYDGDTDNFRSRVFVHEDQHVLIKSTDGAAKTVIEGDADPDTGGCGENARRCVTFRINYGGDGCIQGFTFRKGYTMPHGGSQGYRNQGGGIGAQRSNYGISQHVAADCVFTNCVAGYAYAAAWNMWLFRCHVIGCGGTGSSYVSATVVDGTNGGGLNGVSWQSSAAGGFGLMTFNSIGGSQRLGPGGYYYGTVSTGNGQDGTNLGYKWSTGYAVNLSGGDVRPLESGAANFGANVPTEGTDDWYCWSDVMAELACGDVNGDKILWQDGVPISGAIMKLVRYRNVYVDVPAGVGIDLVGATANVTNKVETESTVTIAPSASGTCDAVGVALGSVTNYFADLPGGTYAYTVPHDQADTVTLTVLRGTSQAVLVTIPSTVGMAVTGVTANAVSYLAPGRTFTLTATETGSRFARGVVVGGVTNLFLRLSDRTFSYTVPEDVDETQQLDFTVLASTDWYVSPTGSNSATGFTPTSPWRTLKYAMSKCPAYERILALPGIYAEGVTDNAGNANPSRPYCRVNLKSCVTLESTDGPEKTVIMGAAATGDGVDEYGRGTNAVACVRFAGATGPTSFRRLRGFTLTGGRSELVEAGRQDRTGGAAVNGLDSSVDPGYAYIENCIITNNFGKSTVLTAQMRVYNSVIGGNVGGDAYKNFLIGCLLLDGSYANMYGMENCTICPSVSSYSLEKYHCVNCLIMKSPAWHGNSMTFTNCVFLSGCASYTRVDCSVTNRAGLAVNDEYVPTNKASAVVDRTRDYAIDTRLLTVDDARGGQRVYNAKLDVGAVEFDWRGEYSADVSKHGHFAVTNATSEVVESATNTVVIADGASVKGVWTTAVASSKARVKVRVVGEGTFTVKVGGETVATLAGPTAAPVFVTFPVDATAETNSTVGAAPSPRQYVAFSFSGSGYAELYKTGFVRGFAFTVR